MLLSSVEMEPPVAASSSSSDVLLSATRGTGIKQLINVSSVILNASGRLYVPPTFKVIVLLLYSLNTYTPFLIATGEHPGGVVRAGSNPLYVPAT